MFLFLLAADQHCPGGPIVPYTMFDKFAVQVQYVLLPCCCRADQQRIRMISRCFCTIAPLQLHAASFPVLWHAAVSCGFE